MSEPPRDVQLPAQLHVNPPARPSHARLRVVPNPEPRRPKRRDPLGRDSFVATLPARIDTLRRARQLLLPWASAGSVEEVRCMLDELAGLALAAELDDIVDRVFEVLEASDGDLAAAVGTLATSLEASVDALQPWNPRVLIHAADSATVRLVGDALATTGATGQAVFSRLDAEGALSEHSADLVILDMGPPDADARALLRRIPVGMSWRQVPVVVLGPRNNPQLLQECISAGVEHVLPKPVAPELLAATLRAVLRKRRAVARDLGRDALTGLMDRPRFVRQLVDGWHLVWRRQTTMACALIDLDDFADLNVQRGYRAGNDALRGFADLMHDHLRPTDVAARWGGDSFAVMFAGTDATGGRVALTRLAERLRHAAPSVAFSAGVAPLTRRADVATTIELAQILLMRSKAQGGATTSTYEELESLMR